LKVVLVWLLCVLVAAEGVWLLRALVAAEGVWLLRALVLRALVRGY
jgi:hypothetical protein